MDVRSVRVGESWDTRDALRHAARQAAERGFDRFTIVDVDAHHYETESWAEIASYIESPVIRDQARAGGVLKITGAPSLIPANVGNQDMSGRVLRYSARGTERWEDDGEQRDLVLIRRAMEMLGIDYQVVFPTPMLNLGLHPQGELEVAIARAYARWMSDRVLAADPRVKTMLYLRFPDLDVIWIESGLAWLPFLMQRLDHEFAMRTSEVPLLERMPSDYIRSMYCTSQPIEITDLDALETTFRMIDAPHRLLYSSDYPHWDFDVPARIYDLPFLAQDEKRAILGGNAMRLFGLP